MTDHRWKWIFLMALALTPVAWAGGPATFTFTNSPTPSFTLTASPSFTPLPTPNGLHVSGACVINITAGQDGLGSYSGDGGPAISAMLHNPEFIVFDSLGNYYFCDTANHLVRKVDTSGNISRYAGLLTAGVPTYGYNGDGIPATSAALNSPQGLVFDSADNLYIADTFNNRIRRVDHATGLISTVMGNGTAAYSADGVPYTNPIAYPSSLIFDALGNMVFIENATRIRKAGGGTAITIAGTLASGYNGDGIAATSAQIQPACLAFSPAWDLYIADGWNNRVRKINSLGVINTVFGSGVAGSGGVGGPATATQLSETTGVGFDAYGDMYVADQANVRVLKMDGTGNSSLVAGAAGAASTFGNGGPAALAGTGVGFNFAFDSSGRMFFCSTGCQVIRSIAACPIPPTMTPTPTTPYTPTSTPSVTRTGTVSATPTASPSSTRTTTTTYSPTASATSTWSPTVTRTSTPTFTPPPYSPTTSPTRTHSPTISATTTPTPTWTASITRTATPTASPSRTASSTFSATATRTFTPSAFSSTFTPTNSPTVTRTHTPALAWSGTATPTSSISSTATLTTTPSYTVVTTETWTASPVVTLTATPTSSAVLSATLTPLVSLTPTPTTTLTSPSTSTLTPNSQTVTGGSNGDQVVPVPNPSDGKELVLCFKLAGFEDQVTVLIFSEGFNCIARQVLTPAGGFVAGWNRARVSNLRLATGGYYGMLKVGKVVKVFKMNVVR